MCKCKNKTSYLPIFPHLPLARGFVAALWHIKSKLVRKGLNCQSTACSCYLSRHKCRLGCVCSQLQESNAEKWWDSNIPLVYIHDSSFVLQLAASSTVCRVCVILLLAQKMGERPRAKRVFFVGGGLVWFFFFQILLLLFVLMWFCLQELLLLSG